MTVEQFDWLAEELTLPGPVLSSYLELLGVRQTSSERQDSTLRDMAEQYGKLHGSPQ